jgi:hypothetical protein
VQLADEFGAVIDQAFCGSVLNVRLGYTSAAPGLRPALAISCFTERGDKIFHLDNIGRGTGLRPLAASGEYVCRLEKLPLAPGQYFFNVMLLTDRGVADHITAAITFDVLPGDFFRTGKIPDSHGAMILTEHSWS